MHSLTKLLEEWVELILPLRPRGPKQVVGKMQEKYFPDIKLASFISKQHYVKDFETITPINLQLDKAATIEASRLEEQQERNRQILYRIIDVVLAKTGHPLRGHRENSDSQNRGFFFKSRIFWHNMILF